jgi:hypothetical protein
LVCRALRHAQELFDHGAIAPKDLESAQADANDAQNSLQALKIFGVTKQELDRAGQTACFTLSDVSTIVPAEVPTMNGIFYAFGPHVKPGMQLPPFEKRAHLSFCHQDSRATESSRPGRL